VRWELRRTHTGWRAVGLAGAPVPGELTRCE
jgi:hypothetical protein